MTHVPEGVSTSRLLFRPHEPGDDAAFVQMQMDAVRAAFPKDRPATFRLR